MFQTTTVQPNATEISINPVTSDIWLRFGEPTARVEIFLGKPGVVKKLLELLEPYKDYP